MCMLPIGGRHGLMLPLVAGFCSRVWQCGYVPGYKPFVRFVRHTCTCIQLSYHIFTSVCRYRLMPFELAYQTSLLYSLFQNQTFFPVFPVCPHRADFTLRPSKARILTLNGQGVVRYIQVRYDLRGPRRIPQTFFSIFLPDKQSPIVIQTFKIPHSGRPMLLTVGHYQSFHHSMSSYIDRRTLRLDPSQLQYSRPSSLPSHVMRQSRLLEVNPPPLHT